MNLDSTMLLKLINPLRGRLSSNTTRTAHILFLLFLLLSIFIIFIRYIICQYHTILSILRSIYLLLHLTQIRWLVLPSNIILSSPTFLYLGRFYKRTCMTNATSPPQIIIVILITSPSG